MPERRKDSLDICAIKEDRGIFKTGVVRVRVEVTPLRRKTSRGDVLCIGFFEDSEIDVIIPGRRSRESGPLIAQLDKLVHAANREAAQQKRPPFPPTAIRFPLVSEGIWRVRVEDDQEQIERRYQFVLSSWCVQGRWFGDQPLR